MRGMGLWLIPLALAACATTASDQTGSLPEDYREIAISTATLRHVFGGFQADAWQISAPFQTGTASYGAATVAAPVRAWAVCLRPAPGSGASGSADLVTYRGGDFYRYRSGDVRCGDSALRYGPLTGPEQPPAGPGPQAQME